MMEINKNNALVPDECRALILIQARDSIEFNKKGVDQNND